MAERKKRELSAKQRRAATLLGTGKSGAYVAKELSVRQATITAWKEIPEFCALRDEVCAKYLANLLPMAIDVFVEQMQMTGDKDKWLRQQAAGRVLAQFNAVTAKDQTANVMFVFGNAPEPGMPDSAEESSSESTE